MNQIQREMQIAEIKNKAVKEQKIISERQEYQRQIEEATNEL